MENNSEVIVLVISNRPQATRSTDLKLLPGLYSTQSKLPWQIGQYVVLLIRC